MRFMYKKPTRGDLLDLAHIRERLGHLLKGHYQACLSRELPPQLLAALKKLDEERPELSGEHVQVISKTEI
jgi:hypothetical protein